MGATCDLSVRIKHVFNSLLKLQVQSAFVVVRKFFFVMLRVISLNTVVLQMSKIHVLDTSIILLHLHSFREQDSFIKPNAIISTGLDN